jgi:hypothetical protein
MNPTDDLASRTDTLIQRVSILYVKCRAIFARRQIEFVVLGNTVQEVPRPFKTQLWFSMEKQVVFIGAA